MPAKGAIASTAAITAMHSANPPRRCTAGTSPAAGWATGYRSRPNKPAGLISSTITMTTKMTVFDASG
jgi:hypothetical protein